MEKEQLPIANAWHRDVDYLLPYALLAPCSAIQYFLNTLSFITKLKVSCTAMPWTLWVHPFLQHQQSEKDHRFQFEFTLVLENHGLQQKRTMSEPLLLKVKKVVMANGNAINILVIRNILQNAAIVIAVAYNGRKPSKKLKQAFTTLCSWMRKCPSWTA